MQDRYRSPARTSAHRRPTQQTSSAGTI